jgi:MraZ protein
VLELNVAPFRGTFDHTLDAKNRLTVPVRYRAEFEGGAVLSMHWDQRPCVCLWRTQEYDDFTREAIAGFLPLSADRSDLERFLYANSQDAELDRAGRIMIPAFLAKHASLDRDVLVVGAGSRLELWSREAWEGSGPALREKVTGVINRGGTA